MTNSPSVRSLAPALFAATRSVSRLGLYGLASLVASLMFSQPTHAETGRIGVSVTDLGNPFFVRVARAVESTARRVVGREARVYVVSNAYNLKRQSEQIDDFIAKKVDLIILIATDPVEIEPAVRKAQAAGIRVVAVDVRAAGADATFTTDNVQAGELACKYIADRLKGQGKVIIVSGPMVTAITDRMAGCMSQLAVHPGIQILSSDTNGGGSSEGGFAKMTDLLTVHPHIDAVFTINDPTALGVEEAALQAGRHEFFIIGIDGAPKVKTRLRDPASLIVGTVAQKPDRMAQLAVEAGYALVRNKPIAKRIVLIPGELLTRDAPLKSSDWEQ